MKDRVVNKRPKTSPAMVTHRCFASFLLVREKEKLSEAKAVAIIEKATAKAAKISSSFSRKKRYATRMR